MPKPLKLLITYNYAEEPILKLLCARMLEDAIRRREDIEVFHTGGIESAPGKHAGELIAYLPFEGLE